MSLFTLHVLQSSSYEPEILRFGAHVHTIVHRDRVCRKFVMLGHNGKVIKLGIVILRGKSVSLLEVYIRSGAYQRH